MAERSNTKGFNLKRGSDVAWVLGSAGATSLWNSGRRDDKFWALGEVIVGTLIAMNTVGIETTQLLHDISIGVATGGAAYLMSRIMNR